MSSLVLTPGRTSHISDGLAVRRLLPSMPVRSVGPFVFLDHMGPARLPPGTDSDVDGHPHIGLATVTWLFEGRLVHRDSLGTVQEITPGALNWMAAGSGIVHSERTHPDDAPHERTLHGLQLWVALPPALMAMAPSFQHASADELPVTQADGARVTVLLGEAFGLRSPVGTWSPTLYLDVRLEAGATWMLPPLEAELAIYSPLDALWVGDEQVPACTLVKLPAGECVDVRAVGPGPAHWVVIGGEPPPVPLRLWWNYVATDRDTLREAALRWQAGGFPSIPGETRIVPGPAWRD